MADSPGGGVLPPFSPTLPSLCLSPVPALVFVGHCAELVHLTGLAES